MTLTQVVRDYVHKRVKQNARKKAAKATMAGRAPVADDGDHVTACSNHNHKKKGNTKNGTRGEKRTASILTGGNYGVWRRALQRLV